MNYADIRPIDVANGPGIRVSLFVSGCTHACPECFNPEAWDFSYGQPFTQSEAAQILQALEKPYIKGLSLLGGSPSTPPTRPPCWILCVRCGPDSRTRTSGAIPAICLRTWPPAAWESTAGSFWSCWMFWWTVPL